jgi:O-acetyl-ADP-ribose deacetylase (regulator of RNase III)
MIIKYGDVFTTDARYIGHGVNCDGKMGAGIAAQVRKKFPNTHDRYVRLCEAGNIGTGDVFACPENDKVIVNLFTQDRPGANARYEWVFNACYDAAKKIMLAGKDTRMAIPQIGAGIGGLEWYRVATILDCIETLVDGFEFEVWIYDK